MKSTGSVLMDFMLAFRWISVFLDVVPGVIPYPASVRMFALEIFQFSSTSKILQLNFA